MRHALVLATNVFRPLIAVAKAAEEAGFDRLWTTESTPRDAIVRAVTLGLHTREIKVATGVAYAFTRAPLAMAAAAADAHIATEGRFALGLGAGTKGMRTRRYGIEGFDHPGSRLGDYADLLRAAWAADDGLAHTGPFYRTEIPGRLRTEELDGLPPIEIIGSGVNEAMLRLSARHCDGVALHPLVSFADYLDSVAVPAIAMARGAGGTKPWIAVWRITSVSADEARARHRARRNLAFYFTTPSYRRVTEGTRWEAVTTLVRDRFRADPAMSFDELAGLIPDGMVDDFCLVGTPESLPGRVREFERELAGRGVSELVFQVAGVGLDAKEYVEACHAIVDNVPGDVA
ncbi:MAG: LLM class flavin-dependent oxidoreductase [Pseudonocardiaceae bacterium]|nr:LLM class flavin-dependent oxidoreductase [Pseudonocardiaceae bacterium]